MNNYIAAVLLALALLTGCSEPAPVGTAITDVTVIDAINGVREHQTVIFDGDEIISVVANGTDVAAANTIDGSGKFLIPGLWDFHVRAHARDSACRRKNAG